MKVIPRSHWTGYVPKLKEDQLEGLPYFTERPEVEFSRIQTDVLQLYRDPVSILQGLLKTALTVQGLADLDYNYAISLNTEGVYTIRGFNTKCRENKYLRVLMLMGKTEEPSDLIKENQRQLVDALTNHSLEVEPPEPMTNYQLGEHSVQVHDLIEYLSVNHHFNWENKGLFTESVFQEVRSLQEIHGVEQLTGRWDKFTHFMLSPPKAGPVGNSGSEINF